MKCSSARSASLGRPLSVMKFGGTSVGDASAIEKVLDIVVQARSHSRLLVVVSAMSGVTNKLIETAKLAEQGNFQAAAAILDGISQQHTTAISRLISDSVLRQELNHTVGKLIKQCEEWCRTTAEFRQLTPRMQDSIASLGERLSAPLVAAALLQRGAQAESIEATQLIVTDSFHGAADPIMEATCHACEARLRSLFDTGVIPVVTGFIGATEQGVLTTLGRGGSDYSATIIAAAVHAHEVIIWTDVDGMLTADPRLVPGATTIPEISYREASDLAHFGARVLHPKTLQPVMQCGIPVWVRNTFAPQKRGTKITPDAHPVNGSVKALSAIAEAAIISVDRPADVSAPDTIRRLLAAAAGVRADVLMVSYVPRLDQVCLVVAAGVADRTVSALRHEFANDLRPNGTDHFKVDSSVSILTVVGHDLAEVKGIVGFAVEDLARQNVGILATGRASSECNLSFVVRRKDLNTALRVAHREFELRAPVPPLASAVAAPNS